ncbi:MAG TPA: stage II sporulation protein M [Firmicutes bacterium]|mgnify:CR=1 FL=1|nr:stage II sporulation protein M [Bacillota bacterium]HWR56641.1 stage II sporulation protein M [Negativicutes bacterium]
MLSSLRQNAIAYFRVNLVLYFFIIMLFLIGVVLGALAVKTLGEEQKAELITYLKVFFQGLQNNQDTGVTTGSLIRQAIYNNIKAVILIWLLGLTVIGVPVILFVVFTRGFVIGFTVGFLVNEYVLRGVLFAAVAVIPHNIFIIPALIITSVSGISFSLLIVKHKLRPHRINLSYECMAYTSMAVLMLGVVIVGGLVEGYVTPVFMKTVTALFAQG